MSSITSLPIRCLRALWQKASSVVLLPTEETDDHSPDGL